MSRDPRPDPGAALMLRFQAGDDAAFEELVQRYENTIYAFLFRFRGREEGAEDLAQEVFLRVFRSRASYRPEAKFSTWLYRIAWNLCINQARDQRELVSLDGEAGGGGERAKRDWRDPGAGRPLDALESRELVETIRRTLDQLPESQRAAVLLHRYHDLSYREIGEAIGVSEKAVKSLMARAREQLKWKLLPYLREEVHG